jgi:hypothetical protein
MIVLLGLMALALWVGESKGSMLDCIDATFRLTAEDGGRGTGVAYDIRDGKVFILTNAHVATSDKMTMEFWRLGHKSRKLIGDVVLRHAAADVAVIVLDVDLFQGKLPNIIPLASEDYRVKAGQTVTSVGCGRGAWPTGWRGNVIGVYPKDNDIAFAPFPALGRSGSGLFDENSEKIIALIHIQGDLKGPEVAANTMPEVNFGTAVNIRRIHAALRGDMLDTEFSLSSFAPFVPLMLNVQCGPRGCPTPQWRSSPQGYPPIPLDGYVLPYRRQQQQQYQQQKKRDKKQDKRMNDLFPTLPEMLPKEEFKPAIPALPDGWDDDPVVKEDGPPVALAIVVLLVMCVIGTVVGLVVQWKMTYRKM